MDNNKLQFAKSLKEKIESIKEKLLKIDKVNDASVEDPDNCRVNVYQVTTYIDQDVLEIALIIQEKREQQKLEKLEKDFKSL